MPLRRGKTGGTASQPFRLPWPGRGRGRLIRTAAGAGQALGLPLRPQGLPLRRLPGGTEGLPGLPLPLLAVPCRR